MKTPKSNKSGAKVRTTVSKSIEPAKTSQKTYYFIFGILVFFLFANTLGHDYNMDDAMVTINHPLTSKGLSAITEIFTSPYYSDAMGYAYGYRPIVHLSFAIEQELFGEKPGTGHFINVLLFAFSVLLFFKLLTKWIGEKNLLFAGIATLLFAIHPIHTEVVASLKNRDEILAFLFVVWSGLSIHKFLEKGKWTSLISVCVLFSIAMLSKKSIFPMVIILPAAFLFTKEISLKQLLLIVILMIIPATLIGSELQGNRMLLMASIPLLFILILYFIKKELSSESHITTSLTHWFTPVLMIILAGLGVLLLSPWLILLLIPLFIWLLKIKAEAGIISIISTAIFFNEKIFMNMTFEMLVMAIGMGYLLYTYLKTKKISINVLLIGGVSLLYFLYYNHSAGNLTVVILFIIFFILANKFPLTGFIIAVFTIILTIIIEGGYIFNFFKIIVLLLGAAFFVAKLSRRDTLVKYSSVLALIVAFWTGTEVFTLSEDIAGKNTQIELNDSFLKEGRSLEYAENTLVSPHSQSEKIATGFLTLGEYLRLHLFPKELSFYYGYAKIKTVDLKHPMVIISIIIHLFLIFLAIWQIRKRPLITIGIMWYLLSVLLFSNWVELVAGMVGERLAFTASAGFCILITSLLFWIKPDFSLRKPGIMGAALGIAAILLAGRTFVRNTDWKDAMTLMGHDIKHLQNSAQANNLYAMNLMAYSIKNKALTPAQKLETQQQAIAHFDQATEVWPEFFNAYVDKGRAARLTKDHPKAIEAFKKAIEINPQYVDAYYNLLEVYEQAGETEKYLKTAEELFRVSQNQYAYALHARAYFITNNLEKAREILTDGLKEYPNDELLAKNLAIVEERMR